MKVSIDDIHHAFNELITEKKSREEIALWAEDRQRAHDNNQLEFCSPQNKEKIWDAIGFLSAVDMIKDKDGNYLYTIDDFIFYKDKYS